MFLCHIFFLFALLLCFLSHKHKILSHGSKPPGWEESKTQMSVVESAQSEAGGVKNRQVEVVKGVMPRSPAECRYGLLKVEKKRRVEGGGCIRELHPEPFHPRLPPSFSLHHCAYSPFPQGPLLTPGVPLSH